MSTRSKAQQNIRSTDRGGVFTLCLAVVFITVGVCFLLGISAPTTTRSLAFFKSLVISLAGNFHVPLPFLLIALGAALAVSSKRRASLKPALLSLFLYICILAFITLISSVTGYGTLMDFTLNLNIHYMKHNNPTSYGAYLNAAFAQFGGRATPLPGGGWIGMLIAFPLWKLLGKAGGIMLIAIVASVLFFALIKFNPIIYIQKLNDKKRMQAMQSIEQNRSPENNMQENAGKKSPETQFSYNTAQETNENILNQQAMWDAPPVQESLFRAPAIDPNAFYNADTDEQLGFKPVKDNMDNFYSLTGEKTANSVKNQTAAAQSYSKPNFVAKQPEPNAQQQIAQQGILDEQQSNAEFVKQNANQNIKNASPVNAAPDLENKLNTTAKTFNDTAYSASDKQENIDNVKPIEEKNIQEIKNSKESYVQKPKAESASSKFKTEQKTSKSRNAKSDGEQLSFVPEYYDKPPERLLSSPSAGSREDTSEEDIKRAEKLVQTLDSFNIPATVQQIVHGPAITRFAIRLGEGVNVNKIRNVLDNLSLELLARAPVRAEIPIPGTPLVGIEVANDKSETVFLNEVLFSQKLLNNNSPTTIALGKDITGTPIICDLSNMPHLLIAGATGSGKSVCINSIITSLLYRARPDEVRLMLVDPKFVELQPYNACPHLLVPVITDVNDAAAALEWLCDEMDDRYLRMQKNGARNIKGYNKRLSPGEEKMPYIVVIIDEMADLILMSGKEVEEYIKRITAKARAAGICLILATQRPSVNVITGVIKANIPSRIAFQVTSQVDSRTILDSVGAEKLLGYGDMLYMPRTAPAPFRVQGCFISDKDVESVTEYVKSRNQTEYNMDLMEHIEDSKKQENKGAGYYSSDSNESFDELLPDAIEMAVESGQTSISMLQRVLRVGYGRAGRLVDEMERRGIIGPSEGTKPRVAIMTREEYNRLVEAGDERIK
ncbi:MAG: DNA translocase FtsK [Christensenellales bacterium]